MSSNTYELDLTLVKRDSRRPRKITFVRFLYGYPFINQ